MGLVCTVAAFAESSPELDLSISPPTTNNWPQLRVAGATNVAWTIQASEDLSAWSEIALLHALGDVLFWTDPTVLFFQDATAPERARRFYRASTAPVGLDDDWKNQVYFPADPFATEGIPDREAVRWVKFSILTNEPARVYYQDAWKYPFHYDFATERLVPLKGISRDEFERVALRSDGQRVLLGAVLLPPASAIDRRYPGQSTIPEFGIQFVGQDPYPPERIVRWFELVRSTVATAPNVRAVYMPVFEQTAVARANQDFFIERDTASIHDPLAGR